MRGTQNEINQYDADTRRYTSSFEPRKVAATEMQAEASKSQADTAFGRLGLDSAYKERETVAKENQAKASLTQAAASESQALTSKYKANEEYKDGGIKDREVTAKEIANMQNQLNNMLKLLDPGEAAVQASSQLGYSGLASTLNGMSAILSRLLPRVTIRN